MGDAELTTCRAPADGTWRAPGPSLRRSRHIGNNARAPPSPPMRSLPPISRWPMPWCSLSKQEASSWVRPPHAHPSHDEGAARAAPSSPQPATSTTLPARRRAALDQPAPPRRA